MSKPVLFFGVCSEGMGHATRAVPLVDALSRRYEVHLFCGGRVRSYLAARYPRVHDIWHVRLCYRDNALLVRRTLGRHLVQLPWALASLRAVVRLGRRLGPVAILTDYECITSWAGGVLGCPVVALGNQPLLVHGALPPPPPHLAGAARVAAQAAAWNTPIADRTLICSFYQPPLRPEVDRARVRYVPVLVRPLVDAWRPRARTDGPIVVYQTSPTNRALARTLHACAERAGLSFVVYGLPPGAAPSARITHRPFSEEGFIADLARAPFAIVNGGHSTITEALVLGKPVLAEPIHDQYEQAVNARALGEMGVGRGVARLTPEDVLSFAAEAPQLARRIDAPQLQDRAGLLQAIERAVGAAP